VLEATVVQNLQWTGNISTAWGTAENWTPAQAPTSGLSATIPSGRTNYPVLSAATTIHSLTVDAGGSINLAGQTLTVRGDLTNGGTVSATTGRLKMTGFSAQTVSGTGTIANLEIDNVSGVTLSSGATHRQSLTGLLTLTNGTLATNGNLTLKSSATGTARLAPLESTAAISGNVTVERYIPAGRKWRLLTAPLTGSSNNSVFYNWQLDGFASGSKGVTIWGPVGTNGLETGPAASMLRYNPISSWQPVTSTYDATLFDAVTNNAYALFVTGPYGTGSIASGSAPTTLSATGTLITGTHTKSLNATAPGQYFLVGNPYASPYDPKTFTTTPTENRSNLDGFLWIWDAKPGNGVNRGLGRYVSFDIDNQRYSVTGYGVANHDVMIQSGQAFFVRATYSGAAALTFREANKGSADANSMLGDGIQSARSWLEVTLQTPSGDSALNEDGAVAFFYEGGNPSVDGRDGRKLMNGSENIYFRREDKNLTFEHRPPVMTKDTMYLRMGNMLQRAYRLQLKASELGVSDAFLIDDYAKKEVALPVNGTTDYDFSVGADSLSTGDRFRVVFAKAAAPVVVTPDTDGGEALRLYPNPVREMLRVAVGVSVTGPFTATVFNAAGVEVWKKSGIAAGTKTVDVGTSALKSGVYTLVLTDAKGETRVEKFVKE
jgi:hypothetical protein